MATGRGSGNQRLINEFQQEYGACARNDQKCCSCTQDDCSACNCHTTRCTSCKNQNCKFKKDIKETIDKMTDKEMHFALVDILDLNLNGFIETVHEIMPRTQENSQSCCNRRNSKKNVKYAIIHMEESDKRNVLKQVVEQDCSDPVLDAIFMNVGTDNNKLPDWYKQKRCCSCTHDDCSACNCHTTGCTSCRNQNCKFKKDIKKAIDSMRSEQTRGALNELMAVQGIANLNQAILGHRFPRDDHEKACSKCKTSNMYDSECSDEDCTYKKKLEEKIRRMDADEGKAALRLILNSNSLNKVEDAVFWNVSNDMVPTWYGEKETLIDEFEQFKKYATAHNFAHFALPRINGFYRHHILTLAHEEQYVTIVQYSNSLSGDFFGVGEVISETFKFEEECLKPVIDFSKKQKCFHIRGNQGNNQTKMEQIGRVFERMEERFYNLQDNNCEQFVNYALHGDCRAPDTNRNECKALLFNLFISDVKSFGLLSTLVISFIGLALSSIVRQSYVRLFVAMLISFYRQDDIGHCDSNFVDHIIKHAKDRILSDESKDLDVFDWNILANLSLYVDSSFVCDQARDLATSSVIKSSIYLLVTWSALQTAFILAYNYKHLKPLRRICITQKKLYLYRKYLYKEVFGGYVPILSTVSYAVYLQYKSSTPLPGHFMALCLCAIVVRIFVCLAIELIFSRKPFRGRHDNCGAVFIVLLLFVGYLIFVVLHYTIAEKFDPF